MEPINISLLLSQPKSDAVTGLISHVLYQTQSDFEADFAKKMRLIDPIPFRVLTNMELDAICITPDSTFVFDSDLIFDLYRTVRHFLLDDESLEYLLCQLKDLLPYYIKKIDKLKACKFVSKISIDLEYFSFMFYVGYFDLQDLDEKCRYHLTRAVIRMSYQTPGNICAFRLCMQCLVWRHFKPNLDAIITRLDPDLKPVGIAAELAELHWLFGLESGTNCVNLVLRLEYCVMYSTQYSSDFADVLDQMNKLVK